MKTILIDSDVCLDVYLFRAPYSHTSAKVLEAVEEGRFNGVVSFLAFANIFYLLRKNEGFEKAITLLKILRSFTHVGINNSAILDKALQSGWKDFEDALQYFCAIEQDCDAIVTRNTGDFKQSELPVYSPAEFLAARELE